MLSSFMSLNDERVGKYINLSRNAQFLMEEYSKSFLSDDVKKEFLDNILKAGYDNYDDLLFYYSRRFFDDYQELNSDLGKMTDDVFDKTNIDKSYVVKPDAKDFVAVKNNTYYFFKNKLDKSINSTTFNKFIIDNFEAMYGGYVERVFLTEARNSWRKSIQETSQAYADKHFKIKHNLDETLGWRRVAHRGACDFCNMLSTRGAVDSDGFMLGSLYKSRRTALLTFYGKKYHDNCRCTAVPVYDMLL